MNILILGDLSGGANSAPLRERRPFTVDRDDIDDLVARVKPRLSLDIDGRTVDIGFAAIDDFHPDALMERVPLLRSLRGLRDDALAGRLDLRQSGPAGVPSTGSVPTDAAPPSPPVSTAPGGGSLLDRIVDETGAAPPKASPAPAPSPDTDLHGWLRAVLAPHLVTEADAGAVDLAARIDEAIASALRRILHHPRFQALESIWRGVSLLVHRLETDAQLRVYLLDITRDELDADLAGDAPALSAVLGRGAGGDGGNPWSVVVGHFSFGATAGDALLLDGIARVMQGIGAPFIAAAAPGVAGLDAFASEPEPDDVRAPATPEWLALRRSERARYIGLVLPRFLLRVPYDPRDEPCETVAFEEMTSPPTHEDHLWGNPALLVALLMGHAFTETGDPMKPRDPVIDGLPLHVYRADGESRVQPCAETLLTDRVAMQIADAGPMVLLSMKNGPAVRVLRLQSIAEPLAALAGGSSRA